MKAGDYTKATGVHGLATGFGDTSSVGVGGITLSGGIGFLVRKNGLTIDDVLAAEVVTADGELLKVDEEHHADLFWALRGGGGNFGVATRLLFRLHEIDEVLGGMLMLPASAEVISGLIAAAEAAPEELSMIANIAKAPPVPFVPPSATASPSCWPSMVYAGDVEAGQRAIAPLRALAAPLADTVRPIRYPDMYDGPEGPRAARGRRDERAHRRLGALGRRRQSWSTSRPLLPRWAASSSACSAARWHASPRTRPRSGTVARS